MRHPREALAELSAGELDAEATAAVRAHLDHCDDCRRLRVQLDRSLGALQMPEPWRDPPPLQRAPRRSLLSATLAIGVMALVLVVIGVLAPRGQERAAATAPPQRSAPPASTPSSTSGTTWPAGSSAEVARNIARDPNFAPTVAALSGGVDADPRAIGKTVRPGMPIEVRALRPGDPKEYLVPLLVDDEVIAIVQVSVDAQGNGAIVASRGWSTSPSFPRYSRADAQARAAGASEAPVQSELVWAPIRGRASDLQPFWRVVLSSGRVVYVFEDGGVAPALDFGFE
jgi:hypothetical protein